jgi:large subunit ribosomal protein L21
MYAVIRSGGHQYRVEPGLEIRVSKLPGAAGDTVIFDEVLAASNGERVELGRPKVEGVKVSGRITRQGRTRKIVVFKYKRRKGYRRTKGHRQDFSLVKIDSIEM